MYKKFISTRIAKDNIADMKRFVDELPTNNDTLTFTENIDHRGNIYINAQWEELLRDAPTMKEYFGVVSVDGRPPFESTVKMTPIIQGR